MTSLNVAFFNAVSDLGFSAGGRQLTVLAQGLDVPLHRWDIATGHEIPVQPGGGLGTWSDVVRGIPIGLSRNLDLIVQRDPTDFDHTGSRSRRGGDLHRRIRRTQYAVAGQDALQLPTFTPDGRRFLTAAGDGVIPVFELTDVAHSHLAQTRSFELAPGDDGADHVLTRRPDARLGRQHPGPESFARSRGSTDSRAARH